VAGRVPYHFVFFLRQPDGQPAVEAPAGAAAPGGRGQRFARVDLTLPPPERSAAGGWAAGRAGRAGRAGPGCMYCPALPDGAACLRQQCSRSRSPACGPQARAAAAAAQPPKQLPTCCPAPPAPSNPPSQPLPCHAGPGTLAPTAKKALSKLLRECGLPDSFAEDAAEAAALQRLLNFLPTAAEEVRPHPAMHAPLPSAPHAPSLQRLLNPSQPSRPPPLHRPASASWATSRRRCAPPTCGVRCAWAGRWWWALAGAPPPGPARWSCWR